MFRRITLVLTLLLLAILFLNFTNFQEPQKVRFASIIPKDSPWEEGIGGYLKNVEGKSGGKLKFKTYYGGQLGGEVEMIKSVAMGSLEGGAFTLAAISEAVSVPNLQAFEMPFLFNNDDEADYVMDKMFGYMKEILDKKGLVLIMWGTNGWRSFGTKSKPISTPDDLKGMKMRSQESDVYIEFYKSMGATPVPITTPEVLIALKTGMVDGYDQTPVFSLSTGWVNTCKYYTVSRHIYQPGAIVLSKKYFEKLSPELQKAVLSEADVPVLQNKARQLIREEDAAILSTFPDFNVKLIELNDSQRDAFKNASKPVYANMEEKMGKGIFLLVNAHLKAYRNKIK